MERILVIILATCALVFAIKVYADIVNDMYKYHGNGKGATLNVKKYILLTSPFWGGIFVILVMIILDELV